MPQEVKSLSLLQKETECEGKELESRYAVISWPTVQHHNEGKTCVELKGFPLRNSMYAGRYVPEYVPEERGSKLLQISTKSHGVTSQKTGALIFNAVRALNLKGINYIKTEIFLT